VQKEANPEMTKSPLASCGSITALAMIAWNSCSILAMEDGHCGTVAFQLFDLGGVKRCRSRLSAEGQRVETRNLSNAMAPH
jgi:hypothetical protein